MYLGMRYGCIQSGRYSRVIWMHSWPSHRPHIPLQAVPLTILLVFHLHGIKLLMTPPSSPVGWWNFPLCSPRDDFSAWFCSPLLSLLLLPWALHHSLKSLGSLDYFWQFRESILLKHKDQRKYLELHQRKFRLDIQENFSMENFLELWKRCPMEGVELNPWKCSKNTWMWHLGTWLGGWTQGLFKFKDSISFSPWKFQ